MKSADTVKRIKTILELQGEVPKMLVPFVWGPPGSGKTDVSAEIAKSMKLNLIDIRLTHYDESIVCGYPHLVDGAAGKIMQLALPSWVEEAHTKPSLVVFDEINRANQNVRNAVLQILCERRLGSYEFPAHVKFLACGNLGEDDGTDVEMLDDAHLNRFAHFSWDPTTNDWVEWAKQNDLNPCIVSFYDINRKSTLYSKERDSKNKAFSTPRTVTALCRLVDKKLKHDRTDYLKVSKLVTDYGHDFIGVAYRPLVKFLTEKGSSYSYLHILQDYKKIRNTVQSLAPEKHSEFLYEIKREKFLSFDKSQVENLCMFLNDIREDEAVGYISELLEQLKVLKKDVMSHENVKIIQKKCMEYFKRLGDAYNETR